MKYNPNLHHRHSIRLRDYDYANAGAYFVTVCLNQRIPEWQLDADKIATANFEFPTFGKIENDVMILNDCGKMVQQLWNEIPQYRQGIKLGEFVIMPDHIHGIIETHNDNKCRGAIYRAQKRDVALNHSIQYRIGKTTSQGAINRTPTMDGGFATAKNPMLNQNLSNIMRWFKGRTAFECRKMDCRFKWQRNYWEHVIRNEAEHSKITKYIHNNPILWGKKHLHEILP
ncbi:MAG: transposase [Fibromonadaceae bacterium]|nr:transposase [Fibromonadaceae bacterium]